MAIGRVCAVCVRTHPAVPMAETSSGFVFINSKKPAIPIVTPLTPQDGFRPA